MSADLHKSKVKAPPATETMQEIAEAFRRLREAMVARGVRVTQAEIADWKAEGRR